MSLIDYVTTTPTALAGAAENDLSRRYLRILTRWIPYGMKQFNSWPGRPRCGHFFGGVLWYCQDTVMPALAIAAAIQSDEFDEKLAGHSRDELIETVIQAVRYAGFTHDSGPADCLRPTESWGRMEPAGKKWGERGAGFFRETNAGRQVANLAAIGHLMQDYLGDEERGLIAAVTGDFLERFIDFPPQSGLYYDTQMEENAWTAFGLTGASFYLEKDPAFEEHQKKIRRWMYTAASKPEDMHDSGPAFDGLTARQAVNRVFTTLPDNTAENHGFVHPSYMKACLTLIGQMTVLYRLWGREIPEAAFHHSQDIYDVLKQWVDDTGSCHAPLGMDWPYLGLSAHCLAHGMANLNLGDPDGALLERRTLGVLEAMTERQNGELIHEQTKRFCHGQQDPAIMRERFISQIGYLYLAHRSSGEGVAPSDAESFGRSIQGVQTFPQGGLTVHTHSRGRTSLGWRNGSMVLPATPEGVSLIGHARNTILARLTGVDKPASERLRTITVRDLRDRVSALMVEDLYQGTVRRKVAFFSLPDGTAVVWEHLEALATVTIEGVELGYLSVMNDPRFAPSAELQPQREVYWAGGSHTATGYAAATADDDRTVDLGDTPWVNVDDRFGVVFAASGSAVYRDIHHYPVWHGTENELVLGGRSEAATYSAGDEISRIALAWLPCRNHEDTAASELAVTESSRDRFVATITRPAGGGAATSSVVAANFSNATIEVPVPDGATVQIGGVEISPPPAIVRLAGGEPLIIEPA